MLAIIPMVRFGQSQTTWTCTLHNADSDLMHHQYRLSVLQWNPGPARKNPTQILAADCGRFILQEASDHKSRTSSSRTQAAQTLPSRSTGTHLSLMLQSSSLPRLPQARTRGVWQLLWFGDLCAIISFGTPTVTLCSTHSHNAVAKKRDAFIDLLQRLHDHMVQHNVDFIGGDFNMSAFSIAR